MENTIIKALIYQNERYGSKVARFLAIAIFALVASGAGADDVFWNSSYGYGTAEEPVDFNDSKYWGKTLTTSDNPVFAVETGYTYLTNSHDFAEKAFQDLNVIAGDYSFSGDMNFRGYANWGADGQRSSILKRGNWELSDIFKPGFRAGSSVTFTNASGNVNCTSTGSWICQIGNYGFASLVNLSGNWTINSHVLIANQASATGIVDNVSGDWTAGKYMAVGQNGYGEFHHRSGAITANADFYIGNATNSTGVMVFDDGTMTANKAMYVGNFGTGTLTVNGGTMTAGNVGDLIVGNTGKGVLTINGGTVELGSSTVSRWTTLGSASGSSGVINLNGGQLKLSYLRKGNGSGSLVFNGGTLVANKVNSSGFIGSTLSVSVSNNGGMIDCGGLAVDAKAQLKGSGPMSFSGGNTITLSGGVSYTGKTRVAHGTTIVVSKATATTILSHGLELMGVPALSTPYTILSSADDLSDLDLANVTCDIASSFTAALGSDGKSIVVTRTGDLKPAYWTGAKDNNLSDGANWSDGVVPTSGNCFIGCGAATTLTLGDTFAPSSITFVEGSARVTISGARTLSGVTAIANHSAAAHVFDCAVSGTAIEFANDAMSCEFRGGITLAASTFSCPNSNDARGLVGAWHFTGDWTPVPYNRLKENSSVTVDGEMLNSNDLAVNAGCVVTAGTLRVTTSTYPIYDNHGRLVVNGTMSIDNTTSDFLFARDDSQDSTVIAGGVVFNTGRWPRINCRTLVVGEDGINFGSLDNNVLRFSNSAGVTLYARDATTTLGAERPGKGKTQQLYTINKDTFLTLCTTRFESDEAATIIVDGNIGDYSGYNGHLYVTGDGTVAFNSASTFTGGMTVGDTATLAIKNGSQPGTGLLTIDSGATLQVAESATATLGGGLTLADGACLGFNYTTRTAPVLDLTGRAVTVGDTENKNIVVKLSAPVDLNLPSGKNVLTAGGKFTGATVSLAAGAPDRVLGVGVDDNGEIYAQVRQAGTVVIVR